MEDATPQKELEMRIAGADQPGRAGAIEAALRAIDPEGRIRIDPATGIVHAFTCRDTLEVADAMARAGFDATAMTL